MKASSRKEVMPEKSNGFWPKPRGGFNGYGYWLGCNGTRFGIDALG